LVSASAYDHLTPIQFRTGKSEKLSQKSAKILIGSDTEGALYLFKQKSSPQLNIQHNQAENGILCYQVDWEIEIHEHCSI
jgi:hypothetical protein